MCVLSLSLATGLTTALGISIGTGAAILGDIGLAVGAAGTALGIAGAAVSADQQQAALDFEAEQAEANRRIQERQAQDIGEQGEWEKRNLALRQRAELASRQASAAGSGVLLNYGSNLDMQEDQAQTNLLDRRQLQYDIESRQYQARLGAWSSQNQLNSLNAQKDNARTAGNLGVLGAGVSGLGSTLSLAASGMTLGDKLFGGGGGGTNPFPTNPTVNTSWSHDFGTIPGAMSKGADDMYFSFI